MGETISKTCNKLVERKTNKVIMIGLDWSGKTTILYKLKGDFDIGVTTPVIGFGYGTLEYK